MAAVYRALDRVHLPLTSPLEDLNPTTAHLKHHEASSLQRLQECTLSSAFTGGLPYPRPSDEERTEPFDINELIVFNIYKTNESSTCYGLGPSPLAPVYLFYPALHPADRLLRPAPGGESKLEAKKNAFKSFFSPSKRNKKPQQQYEYGKIPRPNLIQSFLDRKDLSTPISTVVACVRFYEEYVEWRLVPPPFSKNALGDDNSEIVRDVTRTYTLARSASHAASREAGHGEAAFKKTFFFSSLNLKAARRLSNSMPLISAMMKGKMKEAATSSDDIGIAKTQIVKPKDLVAARIYLKPNIRSVEQRQKSRSFPFFGTLQSGDSSYQTVYTTVEELGGGVSPSLEVHFSGSSSAVTKTYWWTFKKSVWKIIFDERDEVETKSKRTREFYGSLSSMAQSEAGPSRANEIQMPPSLKDLFVRPKAQEKVVQMFPDAAGGTVKVYAGEVADPVGYVELLTGQMWLVRYIPLETADVVVSLIFAVINLEKSIRAEHNMLRDLQGGRSGSTLFKTLD